MKVCTLKKNNATIHLTDYSKFNFYVQWETKNKKYVTCFIVIFTLF